MIGKYGETCPHQLRTLDPVVEEGREERSARRGVWVGAFRRLLFSHFKHCLYEKKFIMHCIYTS